MVAVDEARGPLGVAGGGGGDDASRAVRPLSDQTRSYLKHMFQAHAGADHRWTRAQAKTFIRKVQAGDDATPAALALLAQPSVDLDAFLDYIGSADGALARPCQPCDLSWPLSSYFISSSHNTYLTGNQLSSDSTTEAYTNVLLRGCRCVEVDVWDGGQSDAASSASSLSGDEPAPARAPPPAHAKRRSKLHRLRGRLPESLAARLEKASLGWAADERVAVGGAAHGSARGVADEQGDDDDDDDDDDDSDSDGDDVGEPRVLHGYTLTKEVPFRDVCHAIRDSAFAVTDLPLIVSLEVHCSPRQQAVMVDIMQEAWHGLLVAAPETKADALPSPDQLRGKILIKVKYVPPPAPMAATAAPASEESPDSGEDGAAAARGAKRAKPPKIIHDLSRLGVYTQAVSFKAWAQPEAAMATHIFSLSESKFLDHHAKHGAALADHNRHFLMRVYPSGLRIGSSNLYPPVFWGAGAQVVALNWQQTDEGMMLNEGMFTGTGGYVLKPRGYRPGPATEPARHTLSLAITFLSAQSLPLPASDTSARRFHPYIKTEVHVDGAPAGDDGPGHKARTRTHRGRDADLAGERAVFAALPAVVPELAFVRFTVRDDEIGRDDLAAWACVRLDRLGCGYRLLRLLDYAGRPSDGRVLVKVDMTLD